MALPLDLTGQVYGRLTVLHLARASEKGATPGRWWWCLCECGTIKAVAAAGLLARRRDSQVRSCGCLQREHAARIAPAASRAAAKTRKRC